VGATNLKVTGLGLFEACEKRFQNLLFKFRICGRKCERAYYPVNYSLMNAGSNSPGIYSTVDFSVDCKPFLAGPW